MRRRRAKYLQEIHNFILGERFSRTQGAPVELPWSSRKQQVNYEEGEASQLHTDQGNNK